MYSPVPITYLGALKKIVFYSELYKMIFIFGVGLDENHFDSLLVVVDMIF